MAKKISNKKQPEEVKEPIVLYILTDRTNSNLLKYTRSCGLSVSRVYTSIQELRDDLILKTETCKIAVVDSGLGRFTGITSRKELIDMIGMFDDDNKLALFYTDNALKAEIKDNDSLSRTNIEWHKYISTADMVAKLLMSKDTYKLEDNCQEIEDNEEDILATKGLKFKGKQSEVKLNRPTFTVDSMLRTRESGEYAEIKSFKVRY